MLDIVVALARNTSANLMIQEKTSYRTICHEVILSVKRAYYSHSQFCDLLQDRSVIPSGKTPHDIIL